MTPSDLVLTEDEQTRIWVTRNRGVCAEIARTHSVTHESVRRILYGIDGWKSKGLRVERALIAAGAPFVSERIQGTDNQSVNRSDNGAA